jgi:uncharacterized protein
MEWWLGYIAVGVFVGFFAGLLGIGGGAVIVPMLVLLFELQGIPREQLLHLAVGTSMSTILFTSISSVRAHAKRGAVRWDVARRMTPGIILGGIAGSFGAGIVPTQVLVVAFTIIIYGAGLSILLDRQPRPSRELPGAPGMFAAGFVISGVSALAAVGGAFMSVPFMIWCNMDMRHAIGSAAFIGFPIALVGTLGYMAIGWNATGLPPWSLGYVYLPATLGVCAASMLIAPIGARVSHRLATRTLRRIFGLVLITFATYTLVKLT